MAKQAPSPSTALLTTGKKHSWGLNVKHAKRWDMWTHVACVVSGQCSRASVLMYSFYFQDCLVFTILRHTSHSDQRLHRAQLARSDSLSYPEPHLMSQNLVLKKKLLIFTHSFTVQSLEHTSALQVLSCLCSRWLDSRQGAELLHVIKCTARPEIMKALEWGKLDGVSIWYSWFQDYMF